MGVEKEYDNGSSPNKDEKSMQPLLDESELVKSKLDETHQVVYISPTNGPLVHDKYYLVYFIMMLFGIGCLLPWNVFINAMPVTLK